MPGTAVMPPVTTKEFLAPLVEKIVQHTLERINGTTPGPLTALAIEDGNLEGAAVLKIEEASLYLLACERAVDKVMTSWSTDAHHARVLATLVKLEVYEKNRAIAPEVDSTGVETAYFGCKYPTGRPNYDLLESRLGESVPVLPTCLLLAQWCVLMSQGYERFADACLKHSSTRLSAAPKGKSSAGCLVLVLALLGLAAFSCELITR